MPMRRRKAVDVVRAFVKRINEHNVEGLLALMSEDHLFVDSLGQKVQGREAMRRAWTGYFGFFPDYKISVLQQVQKRNVFVMLGTAGGTYCVNGELLETNRWAIPAAWKAVVRNNRICEWRVYTDNDPLRRIVAANARRRKAAYGDR